MTRKPSSSGSRGRRERERAVHLAFLRRADAGVQERDQQRRGHQRRHAVDQALRHVLLRVRRFLRGERQLLDGEEQPHGKRQRREHAAEPNGSHGPPPSGSSTVRAVRARRRCSAPSGDRSKCGIALTQYTASTASAPSVTMTDTRNDSSTPMQVQQQEHDVRRGPPQRLVLRPGLENARSCTSR